MREQPQVMIGDHASACGFSHLEQSQRFGEATLSG